MFKPFRQEIVERFKLPWKHSAFNSYFIFIIIGFGGIGVFIKLYEILNGSVPNGFVIAQDMTTYSVAIIAASLIDLNLSTDIQSKPSLTIHSFVVAALSVLFIVLSYNIKSYWALIPGFASVILALLVWVLAYADNENLSDSTYYEKMRGKEMGHGKNWK